MSKNTEKPILPYQYRNPTGIISVRFGITKCLICAFLLFSQYLLFQFYVSDKIPKSLCPQAAELVPTKNAQVWKDLTQTFGTNNFKTRAIDWLGDAVRIP